MNYKCDCRDIKVKGKRGRRPKDHDPFKSVPITVENGMTLCTHCKHVAIASSDIDRSHLFVKEWT